MEVIFLSIETDDCIRRLLDVIRVKLLKRTNKF